jgi:prostaglandin-endoperoxide synthase 2
VNWLPNLLLEIVSALAAKWPWLDLKINSIAVNKLVNQGPNRPHPWSTMSSYVSWSSLTDRHYYARLLPPAEDFPDIEAMGSRRPPTAEVVKLFPAMGRQTLCPKSTCLFPAFAQYLTDGFIRTLLDNDDTKSKRDQTTSNHDIDLSQLYGRTREQTDVLRLRSEEPGRRGRLKSQLIGTEEFPPWLILRDGTSIDPEFAGLDAPLGIDHATPTARLTLFAVGGDRVNATPQTAMINTLFLREHNRLAAQFETANPTWPDLRVFETARNCIVVMFIKVVVEEYINYINSSPIRLRALPQIAYGATWNRANWITVEFALLYRWHSLVPQTMTWGGTVHDGTTTLLDNTLLLNAGLADAYVDVSANRATQLGLGNSASFLQNAEAKAVEQGRFNRLSSYAAYRRVMGKGVPKDFTELVGASAHPEEQRRRQALADELQKLYGNVENLEFYIGLFAEPRQANSPLPDLINSMVAMDAFSQALTNPLLSRHVWGDEATRRNTFGDPGLVAIESTASLRDILERNSTGLNKRFVGMTIPGWKRGE